MSRGSESIAEKQEFSSELKVAESPRREKPRQLSLTQRDYSFTLENCNILSPLLLDYQNELAFNFRAGSESTTFLPS